MITSRDKIFAAMTDGLKANFPVVIPYVDIFLRDHWDQVTDQLWWTIHAWDISARLRVEEDLQRKLDLDWVPCGMCPSRDWRENHRVETLGDRVFLVDTLSGERKEIWREPISGTHSPIDREPLIKSLEDMDKQVVVTKGGVLTQSGRLDHVRAIVERFGSEKFIFASVGTPFWSALSAYFGFRGIITNLFRKPRLVERVLEKITARTIGELRAYAKAGVDGIWMEECLSSADVISLAQFERFSLPYVRELISEIRRLGMKSIYYPCGDVRDRLEPIIEAGPDCISLEESKKGFEIDIAWVNRVVAGRTCILGNLDAVGVLQNGTHTELEKEIRRQLSVGRQFGRFIMSLGSPVTPGTRLSRVREYVNIVRQESANT